MDYIFEFIDSEEELKRLLNIGYKPNSLEAALIVWESRSKNLREKIEALNWIKENMPDMPIPRSDKYPACDSFYSRLSDYIDMLLAYIRAFESASDDAVYGFSALYEDEWFDDGNLYSSFERVLEAADSSIDTNSHDPLAKPVLIHITKRIVDIEFVCDHLYMTGELEYYKFESDSIMPDEDLALMHLFDHLHLVVAKKNITKNVSEYPAEKTKLSRLSEALKSQDYVNSGCQIPLIIGYDCNNKLLVDDLAKMRHLLVCGVAMSGKSSFLRNIITCLVSEFVPDDLRIMIFDLKKTEFVDMEYPHMHCGVVTDLNAAIKRLEQTLDTVGRRMHLFHEAGVKSIEEYNAKAKSKMTSIILIFDEYAELLYSPEAEKLMIRLAAFGHAVGVHLIISSQRAASSDFPSAIKANIPARASFKVANSADSLSVLQETGAESLSAYGDMIYSHGSVTRVRVPYAFSV